MSDYGFKEVFETWGNHIRLLTEEIARVETLNVSLLQENKKLDSALKNLSGEAQAVTENNLKEALENLSKKVEEAKTLLNVMRRKAQVVDKSVYNHKETKLVHCSDFGKKCMLNPPVRCNMGEDVLRKVCVYTPKLQLLKKIGSELDELMKEVNTELTVETTGSTENLKMAKESRINNMDTAYSKHKPAVDSIVTGKFWRDVYNLVSELDEALEEVVGAVRIYVSINTRTDSKNKYPMYHRFPRNMKSREQGTLFYTLMNNESKGLNKSNVLTSYLKNTKRKALDSNATAQAIFGPYSEVFFGMSNEEIYCGFPKPESTGSTARKLPKPCDYGQGNEDLADYAGINKLVRAIPGGGSAVLVTYGYSGSGKTFSLFGAGKKKGLVQISLEDMFRHTRGKKLSVQLDSIDFVYGNVKPRSSLSEKCNHKADVWGHVFRLTRHEEEKATTSKSPVWLHEYPLLSSVLLNKNKNEPFKSWNLKLAVNPGVEGNPDPETIHTVFQNAVKNNVAIISSDLSEKGSVTNWINKIVTETRKIQLSMNFLKATPNNPESSRAHTFLTFKTTMGSKNGYLVFGDLAGIENPEEIQSMLIGEALASQRSDSHWYDKLRCKQQGSNPTSGKAIFDKLVIDHKDKDWEKIETLQAVKKTEPKNLDAYLRDMLGEGIVINETLNQMTNFFLKQMGQPAGVDAVNQVFSEYTPNFLIGAKKTSAGVVRQVENLELGELFNVHDGKKSFKEITSKKGEKIRVWDRKKQFGVYFTEYLNSLKERSEDAKKTTKFALLALVNPEPEERFVNGAIKTLQFAERVSSVGVGITELPTLTTLTQKELRAKRLEKRPTETKPKPSYPPLSSTKITPVKKPTGSRRSVQKQRDSLKKKTDN